MKYNLVALAMALTANAAANIMLKSGMRTLDFKGLTPIAVLLQIIGNKMFVGGVLLFGLNVLCYSYALNKIPLSVAYPIMNSVGFIFVVTASILLFGEALEWQKLVGLLLILAGVGLIGSRM